MLVKKVANLKASKTPIEDINSMTYKGQNPDLRRYKFGYEKIFNSLPVLNPNDPLLDEKLLKTKITMQHLASKLIEDGWMNKEIPGDNGFIRTILGMEKPVPIIHTNSFFGDVISPQFEEGTELVLAQWGDGKTSPIHGHATGYLHEEVIQGKMRVNTYRRMDPNNKVVRLVSTEIVSNGTFASIYTPPNPKAKFKRETLVHNFVAIGYSATLHYLPEHTRDGRDNMFLPEYFEDKNEFKLSDVTRITSRDGMYLQKGDVVLVRSSNVPEYGDHYIVVTGPPVMKEHGFRVQDVAISTPYNWILNNFEPHNGLILLKLNDGMKKKFYDFHGIKIQNNEVIFSNH